MALRFEELRVLQQAEVAADGIWEPVSRWNPFARDTVGKQLVPAVDSIGANIAEAYGRFHYGEKLQFLYYARGSLFEAKYWLNRARERALLAPESVAEQTAKLTDLACQINTFAAQIKSQRKAGGSQQNAVRDADESYSPTASNDGNDSYLTDQALEWLQTVQGS